MDELLALLALAFVGGLVAVQAPINAGLGRVTGDIASAAINFAIGGVLLAAILILSGRAGGLGAATGVQWYYLLGGVFGATYVFTTLALVGSVGAAGVAAATITGQITLSVGLDRLGAFGLDQTPLTGGRLLGVALLLGGTYLVIR